MFTDICHRGFYVLCFMTAVKHLQCMSMLVIGALKMHIWCWWWWWWWCNLPELHTDIEELVIKGAMPLLSGI